MVVFEHGAVVVQSGQVALDLDVEVVVQPGVVEVVDHACRADPVTMRVVNKPAKFRGIYRSPGWG